VVKGHEEAEEHNEQGGEGRKEKRIISLLGAKSIEQLVVDRTRQH
jgi:hypothetical protein